MNNFVRAKTRSTARVIFGYFLKGLLVTLPIAATVGLVLATLKYFDDLLPTGIPGLGIVIILIAITVVGYIASGLLLKPVLDLFDDLLEKTPGIKFIYSSIKDVTEAFVGDKKKFTEPVLVQMSETGIMKMGFITSRDLSKIKVEGYVAVYFPHSYNFSGNLFLVPENRIKLLEGNSSQLMKFIVSGGVIEMES